MTQSPEVLKFLKIEIKNVVESLLKQVSEDVEFSREVGLINVDPFDESYQKQKGRGLAIKHLGEKNVELNEYILTFESVTSMKVFEEDFTRKIEMTFATEPTLELKIEEVFEQYWQPLNYLYEKWVFSFEAPFKASEALFKHSGYAV
jgi:hypothetical protein